MTPERMGELLEQAAADAPWALDYADLHRLLASGEALLCVGDHALIVARVEQWREGPVCHLWLAAGDLDEMFNDLEPRIREWAREKECRTASLDGRLGWARALRARGWVPHSITMTLDLEGAT